MTLFFFLKIYTVHYGLFTVPSKVTVFLTVLIRVECIPMMLFAYNVTKIKSAADKKR